MINYHDTEKAKYVQLVKANRGFYHLEYLDENMECIAFDEYANKERGERALAYYSGPHKTLIGVNVTERTLKVV